MSDRRLRPKPFAKIDLPNKKQLTHSEAMRHLSDGVDLRWMRPWADHLPAAPLHSRPWGIIHVHNEWGEPPVLDAVGYRSAADLAWGLEILFHRHYWHVLDVDGFSEDHECHGVFWWLPTDPNVLRVTR